MPLGSAGGQLEVLHGRVWLTRAGDLDDHVVESGQTLSVPASGRAVVEAWDEAQPALVAWQPTPIVDRVGAGVRSMFGRCWDIVDPVRRIEVGAFAAVVALSRRRAAVRPALRVAHARAAGADDGSAQ